MSNAAAKVIRIKIPNIEYGTLASHDSGNILAQSFIVYTPDQEDFEYVVWGTKPKEYSVVSDLIAVRRFDVFKQVTKLVNNSPIPDSARWISKQVVE